MADVPDRLSSALSGRYQIERELGSGGMATVYLAEDTRHHRNVAIKVLREDLAASMGAARFLREIEIAAQLQHPNILPLLDSGNADGFLFYVMPYVAGRSLRERLAREGELPVHEAVRLLTEVVDALSHAHEHGVVHRDIKPDNVMLSGRHALVADFGIAKAVSEATGGNNFTTLGVALGTPTYMSPEQATADPGIDHRSDIYAIGVMAYEMLTGRTPFAGTTSQQVIAAHMTQSPDPVTRYRPGVPPALEALVMRCLAKRPADRWQTAGELHNALEPFVTPSTGITPTHTLPHRRRRVPNSKAIALGVIAIAIVAVASWLLFGRADLSGNAAPNSIAVIPFENLSSDTSMVYFAAGMADEMANALAGVPGLRVMARTSAAAFTGKNATAQEIGRALNVDVVLMGSVRRDGERLLVSAHVDRTSDGSQLFAQRYDTVYANVFQVQEALARGVANRLRASLSPAAEQAVQAPRGTDDVEAYDLYLKGQYFFEKRGGDNLNRGIDYFKRAIARDGNFARAHAGLAMLYSILPGWTQVTDVMPLIEAERGARRALAIDSTLVEGRLALANALTGLGRPQEAEREFVVALAMDPRSATGHQWRGANLNLLGRSAEAIREGQIATELDPLSAVAWSDLGYILISARRFDDAIRAINRVIELEPALGMSYFYVGIAHTFKGQADSAARAFDEAYRADPSAPGVRAYRIWGFALKGQWSDADNAFAEFERTITGSSRHADLVIAYLGLGNRKAALAALEVAAQHGSYNVVISALGCDPTYSLLKSEPRFMAVVKQLGQGMCTGTVRWPIPQRPAGPSS